MSQLRNAKHPGEILLSKINNIGMKQKELAIRTGVSEKHISTIINGTKDISASFARKLDIALGEEIGTWLKLQNEYEQYMLEFEKENDITDEEISILKSMKDIVDYFLEVGIMHNHCGDAEKVFQLRQVLRVVNLSVIPQITYNAAYRAQISASTNINLYILFAWQRMCEIFTEKTTTYSLFDVAKLNENIPLIKEIAFEKDIKVIVGKLKNVFSKCGVAFEVVKHFRGAPVQGFIKQLTDGRVILCLTLRGKKADRFWFSLFHEIGHLINGDLNARFVDFDSVKSCSEDKADVFARDTLIPLELYRKLISSGKYLDLKSIKSFSKQLQIPHWITIGRLQKDEWIDWSTFASEIPSYEKN